MESEEKLVDAAIRLMNRIGAFPDARNLRSFLGSSAHVELSEWLDSAFRITYVTSGADPERGLRLFLRRSMQEGLIRKKPADFVVPADWVQRGVTAAGLVIFALAEFLGRDNPLAYGGLTATFAPSFMGLLEMSSLKSLSEVSYRGPRWPFICTTGRSPRWKELRTLMAAL
jgi:hypothetical protein